MFQEQKLLQLLDKEYGYYNAILEITQQENEKFLRERPLNEISPLMKKKQIFIACIDEIGKELRTLKQLWKEGKHNFSEDTNNEVRQKVKSLDVLLKEILDLDKANNKMLEKQLHALRKQSQAKLANTPTK